MLTLWPQRGSEGTALRLVMTLGLAGVGVVGGGEHSLRQVSKVGIGKLREMVKQQFTAI